MLGTGARYAEYGITGGFFLFTQALILGLAFPEALAPGVDQLSKLLSDMIPKLPQLAQPAFQSLLVALALLSVFIIGLMLELVGSIFVLLEAKQFRKHLVRNGHWIGRFIRAELPDFADDYDRFLILSAPMLGSQWRQASRMLALWKPSTWRTLIQVYLKAPKAISWQKRVQEQFRRIEFALIARVLASGSKTDVLAEQVSICRVSRAISVVLYVEAFEVLILLQMWLLLDDLKEFVLLVVALLIMAFAWLLALGAYSHFSLMLFSLLYASWKPRST